MTLPGARLPRLDPVAVGTPDDALMPGDLCLDGGDGFECRDVRGLALHVVDVERCRVRVVPTVDAPGGNLQLLAEGWDKCVTSLRYEDGSPVEIVEATNPYRKLLEGLDIKEEA